MKNLALGDVYNLHTNKHPVKVYSWNMLFANKKLDQALEFVRGTDADVFCLQEVPEPMLEMLKQLPYELSYRSDMVKLFPSGPVPSYNVILSRYPITNRGEVTYPDYWPLLPLRARTFVRLMRPFRFSKIRDRGGLYADVQSKQGPVRVFNLHLVLAHPAWRLKEFELAMVERTPGMPTIVCGDFNVLESPKATLLNWMFGGNVGDVFFWRRERIVIEQRFVAHELANVHAGKRTHPFSRSQLDHILVSNDCSAENARVVPQLHGSDHLPITAEITLPAPRGA